MNFRQKAYDSYDRNNYTLKITNSYYHFKNIKRIINRKPEYQLNKKIRSPPKLKINSQVHNNYPQGHPECLPGSHRSELSAHILCP